MNPYPPFTFELHGLNSLAIAPAITDIPFITIDAYQTFADHEAGWLKVKLELRAAQA